MKLFVKFFFLFLVLISCKKPADNYSIEGKTTDAATGSALPNVSTTFEQKSLVDGVFTNYFFEVASTTSDANGNFKMEWKKENLTEARLVVSRDYYFQQEIAISPDDLRNEVNITKNISLWPKSSVLVNLQNSTGNSIIKFNWVGTNFSCNCCDNSIRTFYNIADTVFQCQVYGGKWLKYNCVTTSNSGTNFVVDSLYCLPFETNNLFLNL